MVAWLDVVVVEMASWTYSEGRLNNLLWLWESGVKDGSTDWAWGAEAQSCL